MSDNREVWIVRTNFSERPYPSTWRGWLAAFALGVLMIAMVFLVALVASAVLVIGAVIFAVVFIVGFFRYAFGYANKRRNLRLYQENENAAD